MQRDSRTGARAPDRDKISFDPDWYSVRYPDVAAAIAAGSVADAWEHYVTIGRQEDRLPFTFDEAWYLDRYPDVGRALAKGVCASALTHYINAGRREGRLAVRPQQAARIFAYGSFGSNNIGDEAILEGIRRLYPDCIQIHLNKPRNGVGFFPNQVLRRPDFFASQDRLILGGGGLLYDRETVVLMTDLAKAAREAGAIVDIQRIGAEAAQDAFAAEIAELFSLARLASVRSTMSQRIIERMTGRVCTVEDDFAFNLSAEVRAMPRVPYDIPTIALATATMGDSVVAQLAEALKTWIRTNPKQPIRFVHVPHSRSYFNPGNNDHLTGEKLWIGLSMQTMADEDVLRLWQYDPEPLSVLRAYRRFDGVLSSRYHGLVFGTIAETPTLAMARNIKLLSFIEDHPSDILFSAQDMREMASRLPEFIAFVLARREREMEHVPAAAEAGADGSGDSG